MPAGFVLWTHPELRQQAIASPRAALIVLGLAIDPEAPTESLCARMEKDPELSERTLLRELASFGGMYVVLRSDDTGVRLYTDPGAMAPVFFGRGRAASSPTLLPDLRRDPEIDRQYTLSGSDDWYPGGLTPWREVSALLANHRLDVASGERMRFWPTCGPEAIGHREGVERAGALLRGMIDGARHAGEPILSLTGGRDSRVLLAASRPWKEELSYFTIRAKGVKACDLEIPARLAADHGLRHEFVDAPAADAWLTELYDELSAGLVTGAPREIIEGCRRVSGPRTIHLNGNLGAITKSFFWPGPQPRRVSQRALTKEFVNKAPCIREGIAEWMQSLPELPPAVAYNLMYLEQRGSRYAGIRDSASSLFFESCAPFNHRGVFEAVCGLPADVQWGGGLLVDLVEAMWPELLAVPYCRVTRNWGTFVPKRVKEGAKRLLGR